MVQRNKKIYVKEWYQKNKKRLLRKQKEYYQISENKESKRIYDLKYRQENREKRNEQMKQWRIDNKEKMRLYFKLYARQKRKNNPKFRIDNNIRAHIQKELKGKKQGRKWQELVGYTINNLIEHLERQFDDKMNWNNYGSYWHLDYIKPKSLFCYIVPEDSEFKKCWALNNLQPLESMANKKKSNHYIT